MKNLTMDDLFIFFYTNEVKMNRRAILSIISAFELTNREILNLNLSSKEYIVEHVFDETEKRSYYKIKRGRDNYFLDVLLRRME